MLPWSIRWKTVDFHQLLQLDHSTVPTKPGPDPEVTPEQIIRELILAYPPVLGASDIAERTDISRQAIDRRLRQMKKDGLVDSRKIGRVRVWWPTDQGREFVDSGNQ
ncbi:MarR family transcriptional regulator [Halobacteriales archaeon QS_4_69_31]|nr:MAG: MarR family transcriptional regulator [Halobacteriales archaeon QS_4_69_31]